MPKENRQYRKALVTGASSGIGTAVAKQLLEAGLVVYGTTRNPGAVNEPDGIQWLRLEGGTADSVVDFIEENRDLLNEVDILINNAGWSNFGRLAASEPDVLEKQVQLLLQTPIQLTRAVLPAMQARSSGCILNVSSLAAIFPLPCMAAYSAGKAGLSTFTQSLILNEAASGVHFIDFQAGDFRTSFNEHMSQCENLSERERRVWEQFEKHLQAAPNADLAARDMWKAIEKRRSVVIRSGGFFQARIAPLGIRLLPVSCLLRAVRWYYKLPSG